MTPAWHCQICGAGEPRHLVTQRDFVWVECPGCGFICLEPMPSFEAARAIQDAASGEAFIRDYTVKRRSKMRRSMGRVRRLKRRMRGRRLLDVGANVGFLVEAARRQGLEAVGLEINPVLVDHASATLPGNRFICGTMEEAGLAAESFDCVYTSEVIEHLVDVNSFIAEIARVSRPGGLLYLTTPEIEHYKTGPDPLTWRWLNAPNHKLYFNRDNIRALLDRHGFGIERFFNNRWGKPGIKLLARRA